MARGVRHGLAAVSRATAPVSADLEHALESVAPGNLFTSLGNVARRLPVPASVESVSVRLRATDGQRLFHLVAMEGSPPRERRIRALAPMTMEHIRSFLGLGAAHSLARALGLRWLAGEWIRIDDEPAGVLIVGARTDRRPTRRQRELVAKVSARLGQQLRGADRTTDSLLKLSRRLAHEAATAPSDVESAALGALRPRERAVLGLYTEGVSAEDIGRVLFISPHTVRTHVKNAFRRLGVHSRDEAAALVYSDEVSGLL
jgi:DNA-binding CsgD family transcriptional regulator